MRSILIYILFGFFLFSHAMAQIRPATTINFDEKWKFKRGGLLGGEQTQLNDSNWRDVDLPHDWSIEDLPGTKSPFDFNAISQVNGGFTVGGTAWYRKSFLIPAAQKGNKIIIQFDGVYMNADVWINGKHLGYHPYGYTSFWYDLTDNIKLGGKNILAVKVRNEGENSRWYSGSGIYRHVWLKIVEPIHVSQWGTYITTPEISSSSATIEVRTMIVNEGPELSEIKLITKILDSKGVQRAIISSQKTTNTKNSVEFDQRIKLLMPQLWSIEKPVLYTALTEVYQQNKLSDRVETKFGIRNISFDVTNGFQLNGHKLKLKGGCIHHDNGPLGSKAFDRAEERKIQILKQSGFNAIRCSHNPPSPALLNACDTLGMLVIDEAFDMWRYGKNPDDYHLYFDKWWKRDVESMLLRDRNHPSIILWSIGNEIPERGNAEGVQTAQMLINFVRTFDTTRPITSAVNGLNEDKDPYFNILDVGGYNYASGGDHLKENIYEKDHQRVPGRIMVGAESYPLESFGSWMDVIDHSYVIGDFVWTAFDYIGEASIGWLGYLQTSNFYPWNLAFCGDIDICGWKRPQSFYRDALWKDNQISLFVKPPHPSFKENPDRLFWSKWHWQDVLSDWSWKGNEKQPMEVHVYSSCEQVELFLNERSLGKKSTNRSTKFMAVYQVPYEEGELKAIGFTGKKIRNTASLHSANKPVKIRLTTDREELRADGQDLSYITVELLDEKGIVNPKAENDLQFEIEGPGKIEAVANANPISLESYQQPYRKAWKGRCMLIVRSGNKKGDILIKVSSPELSTEIIKLHSN